MPTFQAAQMLRVRDKQLWGRIEHCVTVFHDLDAKRLLFATPGKDHKTVQAFAQDLQVHGGEPTAIAHACMDMSAAFLKGATQYLPNALVSYDRFHIGALSPKERRSILWAMRRNPSSWSTVQLTAMHWLKRANLKSARAWRLKMGLREIFAHARGHNQASLATVALEKWISWARRSRLEPFKRLAATLKTHFDAVVRGMLDNRSNAFVEAMNGLVQQAKRAARGFRTTPNFINIAYLRLSKLTHLPQSPFTTAVPLSAGLTLHRV